METKDFLSLLSISVLSNIGFMLIVPFLPLELSKYDIDHTTFGYIFGIYAVASMVGSLMIGKMMIVFGRKNLLLLGVAAMGVCMGMFSMMEWMESKTSVILFCMASRALQGYASSMIQTTSYAIISVAYKKNKQEYLGYFEGSQGLGCALGPGVGGILYSFVGFSATFYILGGLLLITCPILYTQIPNSIDSDGEIKKEASDELSNEDSLLGLAEEVNTPQEETVTYTKLFLRKVFTLSTFCGSICYVSFSFYLPMMSIRLQDFSLSESEISFFFILAPLSYLIVSTLFISYFTSRFDSKKIIVAALVITGLSIFTIGPSNFLPNSLPLMIFGQLLLGAIVIFSLVSSLTVMIHDAERAFPQQKAYVNDLSSGVFNFSLQLGQSFSPVYGSYMTDKIGFRNVCTTVGLFLILYACIYYIGCILTDKEHIDIESEDTQKLEMELEMGSKSKTGSEK